MKFKIDKVFMSELLIVLLIINYMVVTIILHDNVILKYLRDLILIGLIVSSISKFKKFDKQDFAWLAFLIVVVLTTFRSDNLNLSILSVRKYYFPVLMFWVSKKCIVVNDRTQNRFLKFLLIFISIISVWGIFQAWVLGDSFLRNIGYAVSYKNGYGRDMLNYSFYFGGLGIQRVASTLSNSNVCGLILGSTLIIGFFFYPYIKLKYKNILLLFIGLGFLLTFSRSNFLAILVVTMIVMHPYIPKKKLLYAVLGCLLLGIIFVGIVQGKAGIIYKIWNWVVSSINMTETSAAGRSGICLEGLLGVIANPNGIGYGHVGSVATNAGSSLVYSCENSYLAMALDFGIIGPIFYLANLINTYKMFPQIKNLDRKSFSNRVNCCAKSLIIYLIVMFFFSNHIYDMEAVSLVLFLIGLMEKNRLCKICCVNYFT